MRWDELFADLEGQLDAAAAAELAGEVADRTRRESAVLRLVDRARAARGARVQVRALGAGTVDGVLRDVGPQWLLLAETSGREALVPFTAVLAVTGLAAPTAPPGSGGTVFERLGLGAALRGIARDRAPVTAWLTDASTVSGTLERVGADFVEMSAHAAGEVRRPGEVSGVRAIPFGALAVLRRAV